MRKRDRFNRASTFQKKDVFMIFIVLLYALYLASFIYIANRFNFVFKLSRINAYYVYAMCIVMSLFSIAAFIGRRTEVNFFSIIAPFSFIVMGIWAITISFSVINEILNVFNIFLFKKINFRYYSTFITMLVCIAGSLWSVINVYTVLNIKRVTIEVPGLSVKRLKIVQLSDIHINANTRPSAIQKIFDKAMSLNPDMIVFTGDIIDTDIVKDGTYMNFGFEKLNAKHGVFAVTGNHDHYTGAESFYRLFAGYGIPVLNDESILIDNIINVSGINDVSYRSTDMQAIALSKCNKNYPVLFLSHRPEPFSFVTSLPDISIIQLSGHTHAGQIPPVEIVRRFFMKYNYGIYRSNDDTMYVSSGTRWWGPPMRFGNVCEIAEISLIPKTPSEEKH